MSLLKKGEKKIFGIISDMLKKIPGRIKTRINLAAFIMVAKLLVGTTFSPPLVTYFKHGKEVTPAIFTFDNRVLCF